MIYRSTTLRTNSGVFPGRHLSFGVGHLGWYYRDGSDRIEGNIVAEFHHKGMVFFVLEDDRGRMDVREEFLVAHEKDAKIGYATIDDDKNAAIAEIVMPHR